MGCNEVHQRLVVCILVDGGPEVFLLFDISSFLSRGLLSEQPINCKPPVQAFSLTDVQRLLRCVCPEDGLGLCCGRLASRGSVCKTKASGRACCAQAHQSLAHGSAPRCPAQWVCETVSCSLEVTAISRTRKTPGGNDIILFQYIQMALVCRMDVWVHIVVEDEISSSRRTSGTRNCQPRTHVVWRSAPC